MTRRLVSWRSRYMYRVSVARRYQLASRRRLFQTVSGGSSAHHQELKPVYTASGICRVFLLPTAIVSEFQLTHDSGKKQKNLDKYQMLCIQF
jgi:hypothetical protein